MQNITCSRVIDVQASPTLNISSSLVFLYLSSQCYPCLTYLITDHLQTMPAENNNEFLHYARSPHSSLKLSSLYSSSAGLSRHRWCLVSGELQFASISLMTPNYTLAPALAWPRQKLQILHSNYHSSLGSYLELSSQLFVE